MDKFIKDPNKQTLEKKVDWTLKVMFNLFTKILNKFVIFCLMFAFFSLIILKFKTKLKSLSLKIQNEEEEKKTKTKTKTKRNSLFEFNFYNYKVIENQKSSIKKVLSCFFCFFVWWEGDLFTFLEPFFDRNGSK